MPIANVNGIGINYCVAGRGDPIILIAGFGADLNSWRPQSRAFSRHFRVVAFDNRGVGRSDKPPGPYSMAAMADDAVGLLDHLEIEKAHVVGISMGGMIAQEVAINHPDRVMKLVLCATFAGQGGRSGASEEYSRRPASRGGNGLKDVIPFAFNRPLVRFLILLIGAISPRGGSETGITGQRAAIDGHDTLERLHRIQAPALVVVGTRDRLIRPSSSEVLAAEIPAATLAKIEGGSHTLTLENRRAFNKAVLSFLTAD